MLRFLWVIPCLALVCAGCDDGTAQSGCLEDVEPRAACVAFDETSRQCEPVLPFDFLPGPLDELCECRLQGVADDFPDCEVAWEAEHACIGELSCEDYIALVQGQADAPCRDVLDQASEVCGDAPFFN